MSTATAMKISKKTLDILKNFATINSNILIKPGNTITTITPVKNVLAEAVVEETFDVEFGIWDLNKFLGVVSLFNDPEFEFEEKYVRICGSGGSVKYHYCEPKLLTVPNKKINMPESAMNFVLTQKKFAELQKASSVLQVSDISVSNDGSLISMTAMDKADVSSNTYSIGVGEYGGDNSFEMFFKIDNLKLLPGDYDVQICEKVVSKFSNQNMNLNYWIALEADSNFNK
jgi:hypothetical protein